MRTAKATAAKALTAMLVATALAGCGSSTDEALETAMSWRAPDEYEFVVDSSCGERALIGRFRVVVRDGEVADVEGLDERARSMLDNDLAHAVPTLDDLLQEAVVAHEQGADTVAVAADESDGHPTEIAIDWDANAIDDESCYVISEYRPDA